MSQCVICQVTPWAKHFVIPSQRTYEEWRHFNTWKAGPKLKFSQNTRARSKQRHEGVHFTILRCTATNQIAKFFKSLRTGLMKRKIPTASHLYNLQNAPSHATGGRAQRCLRNEAPNRTEKYVSE